MPECVLQLPLHGLHVRVLDQEGGAELTELSYLNLTRAILVDLLKERLQLLLCGTEPHGSHDLAEVICREEILLLRVKQIKANLQTFDLINSEPSGVGDLLEVDVSVGVGLGHLGLLMCEGLTVWGQLQRFRCEGTEGPPCIVERGSTVHLDVAWQNPGVTNMTQSTVWVSGWGIEIPWVGMETEGCPYLDLGTGCRPSAQARQSRFYFPILIQEMYPAGKYDLKWKFYNRDSMGIETEVACFLFTIKII